VSALCLGWREDPCSKVVLPGIDGEQCTMGEQGKDETGGENWISSHTADHELQQEMWELLHVLGQEYVSPVFN